MKPPGPRFSKTLCALLFWAGLSGCAAHLFSPGIVHPDRSRPVARIETRAGVEYGATTTEGIVFLNQTGSSGPCRVHYYLGPDLVVEDGTIQKLGGVYYEADIDLKHQNIPVLKRDLDPEDELVCLLMEAGDIKELAVELARDEFVEGDALVWPGRSLPPGAGIFRIHPADGSYQFVGLASGEARLESKGKKKRYILFAGPGRMREALATPKPSFSPRKVIHRPDGISIEKK